MTTKKGGHAVPMKPRKLTAEERAAAQWRGIAQKIESTAQMVLCNLANNKAAVEACTAIDNEIDLTPLVDASVKAGADFAQKIGNTLRGIYDDLFKPAEQQKEE